MANITWSVNDEIDEALAYGVLIPIEVRRMADGSVRVSCYPQVEAVAREILASASDPLSDTTLQVLVDAVRPFAAEFDTAPEPYDVDRYYMYTLEAPPMPMLTAEGELVTLTQSDFDRLPNKTDFLPDFDGKMVGLVLDGAICAVAAENPYAPDGTAELNVDTAEDYRGRGFATACVSALARMLLSDGVDVVTYCCQKSNVPSVHVAEKVGFVRTAEFYSVLCYLDD